MNEKIQVLGIEIHNYSAKNAVKQVVEYMSTDALNVIEMVTMDTLAKYQEDEEAAGIFQSFDMALVGDKGILQAAGIRDERHLKEVEELLAVKMTMRYFHKNRIRAFLLSENVAESEKIQRYLEEDYPNVQVIETTTMEEQEGSDDKLLNLVNGAEVDCVISTMSSPTEEQFIYRNKTLVHAKVWLGIGNLLDEMRKRKTVFQKIKEFVLRQILKREMAKKGENA